MNGLTPPDPSAATRRILGPITIDPGKELDEYKKFAFNKDMMQVAVGLILATAFNKAVTAICDYALMPVVNYFVNGGSGNWRDMVIHPVSGMNIEIGHLIKAFLDFLIISATLYIVYVKVYKKMFPDDPPMPENKPIEIVEGEKLIVVEGDKVVVK
jgi:large conductance mechanosensitive channel